MYGASKLLLAYLIYCFAWLVQPIVRQITFMNPEVAWLLILIGLNGWLVIATYVTKLSEQHKIGLLLLIFFRTSFCFMVIVALLQWGAGGEELRANAVKWFSYFYNLDVNAALEGRMVENGGLPLFNILVYIEVLLVLVAYISRLIRDLPADWSIRTSLGVFYQATVHLAAKRIREKKKAIGLWTTSHLLER